jgi:hypothetical protein
LATSGSTDYALTSRQLVQTALELCGAVGLGETASSEESSLGLTHLNLMLKTWGTDPKLFIRAETSQALSASTASYTLTNARRVVEVRARTSSNDTPLEPLSWQDYFEIPRKTQTGTPTSFFFDPQRATRTLYVWPVPDATIAAATTLRYTYHRVIEDSDSLNNDPDIPQEWLEAAAYSLAARLCVPLGVVTSSPALAAEIKERAALLYAQLTADSDDSASVFFTPE